MKRYAIIILALIICNFSLRSAYANSATDPNNEIEKVVTIELTKLDVNDTNLELSYRIRNNTDHDVWICGSVSIERTFDFDMYLAEDAKTLVIKKRLDIVPEFSRPYLLKGGRYVRLQPAQDYFESLSLDVPVGPSILYTDTRANAEFASRLVIEVGFYNEDVLKRIRNIIEVAERFNCNVASIERIDFESNIMRCYFKGLLIPWIFGDLSHFDEIYTDTEVDELLTGPTYQLIGEQVLRIEVDGVHIPYDENAALHNGHTGPSKGRTCFPIETPIWIDGMIMPISEVAAGQAVSRSLCTVPGVRQAQVEEVQEHTGTFECRDIIFESGNQIGVVGNHYFMLANGKWIPAQDLKSGHSLRTLHGTIRIKSVTARATPYTSKVYNLKIKNSDRYFVGRDAVIVRDY
jgi:hypothetical protein